MFDFYVDADFFQGVLEVHHFGAQAFDHHRFRRTQIDTVGRGGYVVLAHSRLPEVCEDGFAGLPELVDVETQFLQFCPSGGEAFGLKDDGLDARIGRSLIQRRPDANDGKRRVVVTDERRQFHRRLLGQLSAKPQDQHGIGGD